MSEQRQPRYSRAKETLADVARELMKAARILRARRHALNGHAPKRDDFARLMSLLARPVGEHQERGRTKPPLAKS
jgi:hypothetical protein